MNYALVDTLHNLNGSTTTRYVKTASGAKAVYNDGRQANIYAQMRIGKENGRIANCQVVEIDQPSTTS